MNLITQLEKNYRKPALPQVQTGDTVRVHQLIKEGNKQRIQVFEGVVIRRHSMNETGATVTVRRIASGVGVEKTFLMHSPNVSKVEIMRRAKVRRNFLSFLRNRRGKSARLKEVAFDKVAANDVTPKANADEVNAEENQDALNDAQPLQEVVNQETRAAASEDYPAPGENTETSDEQEAPAAEAEQGVKRAEPGEGEAVKS